MLNKTIVKLNNIANNFSIKDLENLSGVKAHTIRIWEKRYNLLEPDRTDTNIRTYDIQNLKKLLNVAFLNELGVKISKIADLSDQELSALVREQIGKSSGVDHHLNSLKLAMFNFDQAAFEFTYNRLLAEAPFKKVFLEVFIPLLHQIGLQWQSGAITPAHEHFISNLIIQKLQINIEKVQQGGTSDHSKNFILFLPENEIHEIGLLYLHYELILKGFHSVYLGSSVPTSSLTNLEKTFDHMHFITYCTIKPEKSEVLDYIKDFDAQVLNAQHPLWVLGRNTLHLKQNQMPKNIVLFNSLNELINKI